MEKSFYEKLAEGGWLGTKAQVSEKYGNPSWKTQAPDQSATTEALKRIMAKRPSNDSDE